jgi:hypothetical protein
MLAHPKIQRRIEARRRPITVFLRRISVTLIGDGWLDQLPASPRISEGGIVLSRE